ncbi:hypothetical protein [Salimicrobium halophilum]|uniref:hypothetical protein n=1 Tax=Salimicrobium halophilum TaxID=86666 RepID=UPI00115FBE09|nr:hypothetical protein [Salimicrobium halophilum]
MKMEFSQNKKERKEIFKREYREAERWVSISLKQLKVFHSSLEKKLSMGPLEQVNDKLLEKTRERLGNISLSNVPDKIDEDFDALKYEFSGFDFYIDINKNELISNEEDKEQLKKELYESIERAEELNNQILEFLNIKKE